MTTIREIRVEIYLIVGLILSALIGISLGLIGGGGSIIIIPVLVYILGVEAHHAVDMSLTIVGVTSLIGAALHNQRGTVKLKIGVFFSATGTLSAYFGSRLTRLLSPAALLLSIAALMIVIAVLMLIKRHDNRDVIIHHGRSKFKALLAGLIVGLLTGILGIGGGFLVVPALVLFCDISMKDAVGTSLLIVAIDCCAGLLGHLRYGGFDLRVTMFVTMVAIDGMLIGATLSHHVSPANLKKWFAVFVIVVAVFFIAKNYTVHLG